METIELIQTIITKILQILLTLLPDITQNLPQVIPPL